MTFSKGDRVVCVETDFGVGTVVEVHDAPPMTMYVVQWPMAQSMPQEFANARGHDPVGDRRGRWTVGLGATVGCPLLGQRAGRLEGRRPARSESGSFRVDGPFVDG